MLRVPCKVVRRIRPAKVEQCTDMRPMTCFPFNIVEYGHNSTMVGVRLATDAIQREDMRLEEESEEVWLDVVVRLQGTSA